MKITHTKTPWNLDKDGVDIHDDTGKEGIAECNFNRGKEDLANARHIIKCVNSHDELVNTLTNLIAAEGRTKGFKIEAIKNAKQALLKAESES